MIDSILDSVKKAVWPDSDDDALDSEIIMHVNAILMTLTQLGVGPEEGFRITGSSETWSSFLKKRTDMEAVKEYVFIRTRLVFDPPSNSFVLSSLQGNANEYEWRLRNQAERKNSTGD